MEETKLLLLTRRILESVAKGDYESYRKMSDPGMTCFEPEAATQQIEGMEFHKFFFDLSHEKAKLASSGVNVPSVTTIVNPKVQLIGKQGGVVSYNRLVQVASQDGSWRLAESCETRVFKKNSSGDWINVHFHRSLPSKL